MNYSQKLIIGLMVLSILNVPFRLQGKQSQSNAGSSGDPGAPATAAIPTKVRVSSGVQAALLLKRVAPQYPERAREEHIQGTVLLLATISQHGDVSELAVISGDPALVKAALKAVKKWKYKPYLLQGHPVEVETQIQVNFVLAGG